jgi:putative ABC transport system permease protein
VFRNYLKIALRNLKKHKGYSFINIAGFAISMACCVLIILYIYSELNYDRYHENADRIYRLGTNFDVGKMHAKAAVSNHPIGPTLSRDYPEVLNAARIRPYMPRTLVEYKEKQFFEDKIFYADNSVFDVFSFPMIRGDRKSALATAYSLVITEDAAKKYFVGEDPIGKTLRFNDDSDFTVTGIIKNAPLNSHFTFDMLCSFETLYQDNPEQREKWMGDFNNYTYLLLRDGYDFRELEQKFPQLIDKHMGRILKLLGGKLEFFLQPLTSIHLHSNLEGEISGNSDIAYVYIFAAIALFILLIACINFVNLSTARSAQRAKEVGMRKVLGSYRSQLIKQFLSESITYSFLAFFIALTLVQLALPLFRSLSGTPLSFQFAEIFWLLPYLIGFVFLIGLIAGSYPAFFLSAFRPVRVLKGHSKAGTANSRFRSVLVVVQFAISIILIVGTGVIVNQLHYMREKRLGFDKEHVVVLPIREGSIIKSIESVKEELKGYSGVVSVAASSGIPGHGASRHNAFLPEGFELNESQMIGAISIDEDFIPTLDMEVIAGRNFSPEFVTDNNRSALINETAAREFGWDDPVGKTITELTGNGITKTVIGVVRDFHIESLRKKIEPLYIENEPSAFSCISIRIRPRNISGTMDFLRKKWKEFDSSGTFDYAFLDESFDSQYRAEERLSTIFSYFTLFAVFIACLGLFGLASFTAEQRTKEIGIRKVLGASVGDIVILLSKEFTKWVLLANIIAWPVAYYAMNKWLQDFAYRVNMGIWIFILAGVLAVTVALLTVSYQAIKSALSNPVETLRYE